MFMESNATLKTSVKSPIFDEKATQSNSKLLLLLTIGENKKSQ